VSSLGEVIFMRNMPFRRESKKHCNWRSDISRLSNTLQELPDVALLYLM
jgi:hypothetical protein